MSGSTLLFLALFLFILLHNSLCGQTQHRNNLPKSITEGITYGREAPEQVKLAAKEIRRYLFLCTGKFLQTAPYLSGKVIRLKVDRELKDQEYRFKTEEGSLLISGGSPVAVLYGAYAFVEKFGVRFSLHGDVIPDTKIPFALPDLDERHEPLFELRGILPFHDFTEGPDWWNADDYKAYCTQMTKMRMNFIGLHTYPLYRPWKHVNPEPAVWIGQSSDVENNGHVKFSYPASWANTARPGSDGPVSWGCAPMKTSDFRFGAADLFETDDYGAEVMTGLCPWPKTTEQCNTLFNRTGDLFHDVFGYARKLGVKSCVGIETPFWIPDELRTRLKASGKNPDDPSTISELYKGIYQRIIKTHELDYFWIWTPERSLDTLKTARDFQTAYDIAQEMKAPFNIATCGWGYLANNFERFDNSLSKNITFSCINDDVGFAPVTMNFGKLKNRSHWAIPWLEDDTYMTIPQLWAGRIFKDAIDARKLGCSGLMGIHWRTSVIAPNIAALARAGWSQDSCSEKNLSDLTQVPGWLTKKGFPKRMVPADEFYADWCRSEFGENIARDAAKIFSALDGRLPRKHAQWAGFGPGAVGPPDLRPWDEVKKEYAFVEVFADLRSKVSGAGNLERFDYWCGQFRYMLAMARVCCTMGKQDKQMLVRDWTEMMTQLIQTVSTPGELGTIANLEQHSRTGMKLLAGHEAELPAIYAGKPRLIVPTIRNLITKGESLKLKIIALNQQPVKSVMIYTRPLGSFGKWNRHTVKHIARAVWNGVLPSRQDDFEYYITAETSDGKKLVWPATAPEMNQTVVIF